MFRASFLLMMLSLPSIGVASSNASLGAITCSSSLTLSITDSASFQCDGDFAISGGSITSDLKITLAANGSLVLDNIAITAPVVELTALNGLLSIADSVVINSSPHLPNPTPPRLNLEVWRSFEIEKNVTALQPQPGGSLASGISNISASLQPRSIASGGSVNLIRSRGGIQLSGEPGINGANLTLSDAPVSIVPVPQAFWQMSLGMLALLRLARREGMQKTSANSL